MIQYMGLDTLQIADSITQARTYVKEIGIEPYVFVEPEISKGARRTLQTYVALSIQMTAPKTMEADMNRHGGQPLFVKSMTDAKLLQYCSDDMRQLLVETGLLNHVKGKTVPCDQIIESRFDELAAEDIDDIRNARTLDELKSILTHRVRPLFHSLHKMLERHAMLDTHGRGQIVYHNLARWGAFKDTRAAITPALKEAIDLHLSLCDVPTAEQRASWDRFNQKKSLVKLYGIYAPEGAAVVGGELADQVEHILWPYGQRDEAGRVYHGADQHFPRGKGLMFEASPEAALAVVSALPHLRVFNHEGHILKAPEDQDPGAGYDDQGQGPQPPSAPRI